MDAEANIKTQKNSHCMLNLPAKVNELSYQTMYNEVIMKKGTVKNKKCKQWILKVQSGKKTYKVPHFDGSECSAGPVRNDEVQFYS